MMKKTFIVVLLVLSTSCTSSGEDIKKQHITNRIVKLLTSLEECYDYIVILPGSGCSGCITVAEEFFKENCKSSNYYFILTNIRSLKVLKHKIGLDATKLSNVLIDHENIFSQYDDPIYPVVISIDCIKEIVKNVKFQKPGTNAFSNL